MDTSTDRPRPILVGIDGSDESIAAARWAAGYADRVHVPLILVHAVAAADWYGSASFVDGGALETDLRRIGRDHLSRALAEVRTCAPNIAVETVSAEGTIAGFVEKTPAELVVLGSGKSGYLRDLTLGSNALRVANHAQGSVLIWRGGPNTADTQRPIVVGVDGSEHSDHALAAAFEMAHVLGTPLIAANYYGMAAVSQVGYDDGYIDWDKVRAHEKAWLEKHVQALHEKYPDVELTTESAPSSPTRGLRTKSADASIVVVGSRGRGIIRGALLGSVSQNLVHHAESSVLIVR